MKWFIDHYLDDSGLTSDDVRVSPLNASEAALSRTPPAFLITAEFVRCATRARRSRSVRTAGVDVTAPDGSTAQIHAFYTMPLAVPAGAEAIAQTAETLGKAFI